MNEPSNLNKNNYVKVRLIRSISGRLPKHRATIASLGLKRLGSLVTLPNNKAVQGMLRQIDYLIERVKE